jgi:apolipoprotein N-acyltransferase
MKRLHLLLLAVLSGLLFAASWPVHGFTPLIFVAWVPLFFIQHHLEARAGKGMFLYALLSFLLWNGLTTWWIWNSTGSGAITAIVLNALFMATVFQVYHISKKYLFGHKAGLGILIFYWISWEYFHMNWDLSWPWLTLGNVFASKHLWIQWYEYTGVLGGSFWVLWVNILIFKLLQNIRSKPASKWLEQTSWVLLLTGIPLVYSLVRYHHYKETGESVEVVVVQPNVDPYTEEYGLPPAEIVQRNLNLANQLVTDSTDYVIFPESAIQEGIWEDNTQRSQSLKSLRAWLSHYPGLSMIIGASTFRWLKINEPIDNAARKYKDNLYYYAFNTAFFIDNSPYLQVHHKSILVPGVEKMPSWRMLRPLERYAVNLGGIVGTLKADDHTTVFANTENDEKIGPAICYESVYGDYVADMARKGAQLIAVITNDGWWGNTPGYKQHFLFSVLRAIECRRDVARSANTGTSAFINQKGNILQKTAYWKPAVIKQNLHLNNNITYYVAHGNYLARISGYISALILLASVVQGLLKKKKSLF